MNEGRPIFGEIQGDIEEIQEGIESWRTGDTDGQRNEKKMGFKLKSKRVPPPQEVPGARPLGPLSILAAQ
jgi:hypothetical protein